jgi:hypothetical protein
MERHRIKVKVPFLKTYSCLATFNFRIKISEHYLCNYPG